MTGDLAGEFWDLLINSLTRCRCGNGFATKVSLLGTIGAIRSLEWLISGPEVGLVDSIGRVEEIVELAFGGFVATGSLDGFGIPVLWIVLF